MISSASQRPLRSYAGTEALALFFGRRWPLEFPWDFPGAGPILGSPAAFSDGLFDNMLADQTRTDVLRGRNALLQIQGAH